MNNFRPLEVVGRGSETQLLQVDENLHIQLRMHSNNEPSHVLLRSFETKTTPSDQFVSMLASVAKDGQHLNNVGSTYGA